jgi:hypothetical protein
MLIKFFNKSLDDIFFRDRSRTRAKECTPPRPNCSRLPALGSLDLEFEWMGGLACRRDFSTAIGVGQHLPQTGFVFVFFGELLVLVASDRRRRPQHRARRRLHRAGGAELLELFLFRHDSYLTTKGTK